MTEVILFLILIAVMFGAGGVFMALGAALVIFIIGGVLYEYDSAKEIENRDSNIDSEMNNDPVVEMDERKPEKLDIFEWVFVIVFVSIFVGVMISSFS